MDLPLINYPDVCTEQPAYGSAFCPEHKSFIEENYEGIPTTVRGFLKYCGLPMMESKPGNTSQTTVQKGGSFINTEYIAFHNVKLM